MTGVGYNQMERLIMLGTGNALVTRCYNTCFAIQDDDEYFLVDAGGGNGIMRQLQDADISMAQIHHIFLTHEHTDHLLGMIWMIRMIATKMRREQYEGNLRIYCHSALVETVRTIANLTLPKKFTRLLDHRIQFVPLHDGDTKHILDYDVTFFDILSTKAKQYGFTMRSYKSKTASMIFAVEDVFVSRFAVPWACFGTNLPYRSAFTSP